MMLLGIGASAQIIVNEGFEGSSLPSGWAGTTAAGATLSPGGYGSSAGTACVGSKAVYKNLYDLVPSWNMVYTSTASNATALTYSFKYLAKGYSTTTIIDGTVAADYSIDNGVTWTDLLAPVVINSPAGTPIPCATVSGSIPAGVIPVGASFKFRLKSTAVGTADFYMGFDDVQLSQTITNPPACTTISSPANAATGISVTPSISWAAGTGGTNSYDLYLGTTPGGTNIINGLNVGNVTTYSIPSASPLSYSTQYYVKVVPRNIIGPATSCNELTFTTTTVPCPTISAPASAAINVSVTPTISWSAVAAATGYKLRVGTTAGGSDVMNDYDMGNVTSFTLPTALNNSTVYYYTVKSYTATSLSASCTERSFATVCSPTTAPYSQNFDTTATGSSTNTNAPTCWSYVETSGSAGYGYVSSTSPASAPNCYLLSNSTDTTGNIMLVSPQTTNLTDGTRRVRFMAKAGAATGYTVQVGTLTDPSNPASFTAIGNNIAITNAWAPYTVNIPTGTDQYLVIKHGLGGSSRSVYIDDVFVESIPSCLETTGVVVGAITSTSVGISWTAPATPPAGGYDIYYSTSNVPPISSTTPSMTGVTGTSTVIPGLTANTTYYIWVRSRCSASGQSVWTTAVSAYTGHCIPTGGSSSTSYYLNNVTTTTLGYTNLGYTASTYSAYLNNTATSFSGTPGGNIDYSLKAAGGSTYYYYIWVDWNNDLDFDDAGETMLATTSYSATSAGSFAIPAGQAMGNYRARFGVSYTGSVTACGPAPYGNYIDYTLNVVAPPTCIAPTAVTISSIGTGSATVSWTASTTPPANGYDIYYSTTNTAPTASTVPNISGVTGITQVINSLSSATLYYVWVRSHCSSNDISSWSSVASFMTACAAVQTLNENFDSTAADALPPCWSSIGSNVAYAKVTAATISTAPNALYLYTSGTSTGLVATPELANLDSNNYSISFKGRANFTVGGVVQIGYLTDPANTSSFVVLGTYTTTSLTNVDSYSLNITGVPLGVNKLVLKHTGSPSNSVLIDDFTYQLGNLSTSEVGKTRNEIKVYPNPFSDTLNISDVSKVKSVLITDAAGRVVKTIENPSSVLQLGDLKQGMYLVILDMKDGSKQTVKTIKK